MKPDIKDKFTKPADDDDEAIRSYWRILQTDLVSAPEAPKPSNASIDYARLRAIVESNADKINDAKGIMELLPDIQLVRDILIASILSPKDLTDVQLNITVDKEAPPELAELIREHFTTVYDLDSKLAPILTKALFEIGSHTLLALPPTAIRNMIQANTYGLEGYARDMSILDVIDKGTLPNIGLLATNEKEPIYAMESLTKDFPDYKPEDRGLLEITDNALYLLYPALKDAVNHRKLKETLVNAYGLEGLVDTDKDGGVYLKTNTSFVPTCMLVPGDVEKEEFNPIVINPPSESVIPVFIPSEPEKHVGYFFAVDETGNFVHLASKANRFKELNDRLNEKVEANAAVINTTLGITTSKSTKEDAVKPILEAYIAKVEAELQASLSKNKGIKTVTVAAPDEIYRVMLSRQLQKQKTRLVYVPAEMVTYIAFNYNDMGIGESLLDKTKLYASLRAILLFATVMAGVKNSVSGQVLNVTLDEQDSDPQGTVETILNEFVSLQTSSLPIGRLNPTDIVNALQRAGIQIKVNGGGLFPGTAMDVTESKREIAMPDNDLSTMLKTAHYAGLWVSPELVDKSLEGDFATGIVASNLLQAKRVKLCQIQYTDKLSDFIHKYIYAGGPLFTAIKKLHVGNKAGKLTLEDMIKSIQVNLPKPDTAVLKAQYDEYQDYTTFITDAVDLYLTEGALTGVEVGDTTETSDAIKAEIIAYLKRQYIRNQNLLPEIDAGVVAEDSVMVASIEEHNNDVQKVIGALMKKIKANKAKIAALTQPADDGSGMDDGSGTPDDTTPDDTTPDDTAPDDTTPDDTTVDDTTPDVMPDDTTPDETPPDTGSTKDKGKTDETPSTGKVTPTK